MAIDTTTLRTRRALLGAGFGAIAATVATALGKPLPVKAEGETIRVGGEYRGATSTTWIQNRTNRKKVLVVGSDDGGLTPGTVPSYTAITGFSEFGVGVVGVGDFAASGVYARSLEAGVALQVDGPIRINQGNGVATIPAGETSVEVGTGYNGLVELAPGDFFVLLTPRSSVGSRSLSWVQSGKGSFVIRMSKARSRPTDVGYLVVLTGPFRPWTP